MTPANLGALALAFSVAILFGYAITSTLLSRSLPRHFAWVFAPAVGLGVCSVLYFLFRRPIFTVESVLAVMAVWYLYRRRRRSEVSTSGARLPAVGIILCAAMGLAFAALALRMDRIPHGDWDGWAIWNTHARFLFRMGPEWRSGIQYSFHNDYPLLTPALAARFWRYAGSEVPDAGALVGMTLALSAVTLLALTLSELRGAATGVLFALVLLSTPSYLGYAVSQYADVPLSFFILGTVALICLYSEHRSDKRILMLAGLSAGFAGWTKNEGLLLIAAACLALLLPRLRHKLDGRFLAFCCGLAVPVLTIILFKLTILGRNDLIEAQQAHANTIEKLLTFSRYSLIAHNYGKQFLAFGAWTISPWIPLLLFILFRGIDGRAIRSWGWTTGAAVVGLVLTAYYFVYVVTPIDLQLHLDTSLDRLFLHLWPSVLLLAGLLSQPVTTIERTVPLDNQPSR